MTPRFPILGQPLEQAQNFAMRHCLEPQAPIYNAARHATLERRLSTQMALKARTDVLSCWTPVAGRVVRYDTASVTSIEVAPLPAPVPAWEAASLRYILRLYIRLASKQHRVALDVLALYPLLLMADATLPLMSFVLPQDETDFEQWVHSADGFPVLLPAARHGALVFAGRRLQYRDTWSNLLRRRCNLTLAHAGNYRLDQLLRQRYHLPPAFLTDRTLFLQNPDLYCADHED